MLFQGRECVHAHHVHHLLRLPHVQRRLGEVGSDMAGPLQSCPAGERGSALGFLQDTRGEGRLQRYSAAAAAAARAARGAGSSSQRRERATASRSTATQAGVLQSQRADQHGR